MLERSRCPFAPVGHSPSASRASIAWPTISPAVRLRTQGWVPVWQNEQFSVQPTCEETQSAPRSSSGMNTVSASLPSPKPTSHLRVPSDETCALDTPGREIVKRSASSRRSGFASVVIASNSVAPRQ